MTPPLPDQDEHLPDRIEAFVHQAGLEVRRRLFRALIEKADQELVLQRRHGKGGRGIQRRGTRPYTSKTTFGEVTVRRSRIRQVRDGAMEVPSALARHTPHQLAITQNLRDAVRDQMGDQSAGKSRVDVGQHAGDEDLVGLQDDLPECEDGAEAEAEWEQVLAEWTATGFPGCEPAFPVAADEPRAVDPGYVIV